MKRIEVKSMDSFTAMIIGTGQNTRYTNKHREVDWDLVRSYIEMNKESLEEVEVGLAEDWGATADVVWDADRGYYPKEEVYVYASSSWATPAMRVTGKNGYMDSFEAWKKGHNENSYFDFTNEILTTEEVEEKTFPKEFSPFEVEFDEED